MVKKRRGRKKKDNYFGSVEEQAVIDYITTDSYEERNRIYNDILAKPFQIMTESILRKYPIHIGNYDIEIIEANALSHLMEKIFSYNPNVVTKNGNKTKAYSYCQTIIRNFYRDHSKNTYKKETTRLLSWEDYSDDIIESDKYLYDLDDDLDDLEILIEKISDSIEENIEHDKSLKKNEILVGSAIVNILRNWHILFLENTPIGRYNKKISNKYQKNKILELLKEQTRLNTKDIRIALKPFKELYFIEKKMFFNGELDE